MATIRSVCVYCGSSPGGDPEFIGSARAFGKILADNKIALVYGGGSGGLMGALASSVHRHGGRIVGIIPEFLKSRERVFADAQEVIVTRDMHERKRTMFERADAFVALPGGIGTLEETVEQLTWSQLGRHKKPILLANVQGFWDPLIALLDHMKQAGFIHSALSFEYLVTNDVDGILPALQSAVARRDEEQLEGATAVIEKL